MHPYQLLNFNGRYDDLSTLAHESGHSMHTFLSHGAQPYPTSDYPIFVAEVASTFNENLLIHYMLDRAKDDPTRLFLLGTLLDGLRTTLFRQTQFAEFELAFHEQAERGEPLTGENLSKLYLKIARDYYGHAKQVCQVDDLLAIEWAYVPHFYYNFYVYQYATSMVASTSLARAVRDEAKAGNAARRRARRDAYLKMLSSGSAKYAIDLLKDAGVDMTTSAPFDAAIAEMNGTMDEMERILDRQGKPGAPSPKRLTPKHGRPGPVLDWPAICRYNGPNARRCVGAGDGHRRGGGGGAARPIAAQRRRRTTRRGAGRRAGPRWRRRPGAGPGDRPAFCVRGRGGAGGSGGARVCQRPPRARVRGLDDRRGRGGPGPLRPRRREA